MTVSRRTRRVALTLTLWLGPTALEPTCQEVYWWCRKVPPLTTWAPVAELLDACEGTEAR